MPILHRLWCCVLIILPHFISIIFAEYDTYIIHMDSSYMPKAFSTHHNWYLTTLSSISNSHTNSIKPYLSSSSSPSKLIYTYTNAINGFTAFLSPSELESLSSSPGFVSSVRDSTVKLDTTHSTQFLGLNDDYGAWPASKYGHDVIIGLVDTGVWPESQSYNDVGLGPAPARWKGACDTGTKFNATSCNNKLIGARYFNKGLLAKNPNLTIAVNSARDTDGHGTHTSSTAAGAPVSGASFFGYAPGTARGAAPGARVAMYKALWDEGSRLSDIIAAMDQAIADGVDVISISLGIDGLPLYSDPIAVAAFAAMEKGIFVATSAGNEGPFLATLHNGTPWVLNVAASTIDREFRGTVALANGASVTGLAFYPGRAPGRQLPLIRPDSCTDPKSLKSVGIENIIVCVDTNDTLSEQVFYAGEAKLAGAVFISNATDLSFYTQSSFPSIFLTPKQGNQILNYLKSKSNHPKATLHFQQTSIGAGSRPAPMLAGYSSRGPSPSCPYILKPDLTAPGDQILASWPTNSPVARVQTGQIYNKFNIISGTSMSCPHAAGVAALLRGAHPGWTPAAIRSAMMTSATPHDSSGRPIADLGLAGQPATPLDMGAGHVDPNKALSPGLVYDAGRDDYVNLMCALNFTDKQIHTVIRSSSYNCSNPSIHLNYPSFIAFFNVHNEKSSGEIQFREFHRTVTNVEDRKSVYTAKLTAASGLNVTVSPGILEFNEENEKKSFVLRVEDPRLMRNNSIDYGSLIWVESNGKFSVRSPIVVTNISPDLLPQGGESD